MKAPRLSSAQQRLLDAIRAAGETPEYWPIVNDWVRDRGPAKALALRNIKTTVNALVRAGVIRITDDGCFQIITPAGPAPAPGASRPAGVPVP